MEKESIEALLLLSSHRFDTFTPRRIPCYICLPFLRPDAFLRPRRPAFPLPLPAAVLSARVFPSSPVEGDRMRGAEGLSRYSPRAFGEE